MTRLGSQHPRNALDPHAAFALHGRGRMRFALVACALCLPLAAHAQSTPASAGTCSGEIAGSVGLAVPQPDGSLLSIPTTTVPTVFGQAECECAKSSSTPKISLEIRLTQALPLGTTGSVEIWVGPSTCTNFQTRSQTNQTQCEKIAPAPGARAIDIMEFTKGSNSNGLFEFDIPADKLASPNMSICDPDQNAKANNGIFVFVITNDATMPAGTCSLQLTEQNKGPQAPANAGAAAGDGAVTVTWTPPAPGSFVPSFFQVLCADDCGNPIKARPNDAVYSTCINGMIQRRDLTSGGSASTGPTDGGVGNTDLGTASVPLEGESLPSAPAEPNAASPIAGCNVDAGAPSGTWDQDLGPLTNLDPAYICSGPLAPSSSSARISGLNNFQTYHFVVVGIDQYGNASPSNLVTATPQPTEDLYRRYRNAGGGAGHCFVATAAFGSYENRWVHVLRDFRDQELLPRAWGRSFVGWYYAHSPPAAAFVAAHGWARALTRVALVPLIAGAWFWLHVPAWGKALVLTLLFAFALRRRLRVALRRETPA